MITPTSSHLTPNKVMTGRLRIPHSTTMKAVRRSIVGAFLADHITLSAHAWVTAHADPTQLFKHDS